MFQVDNHYLHIIHMLNFYFFFSNVNTHFFGSPSYYNKTTRTILNNHILVNFLGFKENTSDIR